MSIRLMYSQPVVSKTPEPLKVPRDRPWADYPPGTKAHAVGGGYWLKVKNGALIGWHWNGTGVRLPRPGADAVSVELPPNPERLPVAAAEPVKPPRVLVILEGGMITHCLSDADVHVLSVDYTVYGWEPGKLVAIPQGEGYSNPTEMAGVQYEHVDVEPERCAEIMKVIEAHFESIKPHESVTDPS